MRLRPGDQIKTFELPALDGRSIHTDSLKGRPFMLSFMRFATCPFCNLRIHQLIQRFDELPDNFAVVAVFDSDIEHLRRSAERHESPFPILADGDGRAHQLYGVEHSVAGVFKGMVLRVPQLMKAMFFHGYWPFPIRGSLTTMPADFLVDPSGVIQTAYYGKDEGDHLPVDRLLEFAGKYGQSP